MGWPVAPDIASRIRELRDLLGLSQAEMGRLCGRSWKAVSAWERGRQVPHRQALELAAARCGWPREIFEAGGPRPAARVNGPVNARWQSGRALHYVRAAQRALEAALAELESSAGARDEEAERVAEYRAAVEAELGRPPRGRARRAAGANRPA